MDITIDCGYLYFGINCVRKLEDDLFLLQNAMNKVNLSAVGSELASANTFDSVKSSLKGVLEKDVDDLVVRLDNIKRILAENDRQAAYLFNYYEEGIISGDFQFTEMPLMSQTDYNDIPYSQGTIKTSGCGLTSVCMVASYLTGNLYTPSELVGATRGYGDNVSRMLAAAKSVGLVWHNDSGTSHDDLDAYLREGKIAVVLVRDSGHFVVCTGITEDGKYLVNDPYGPWVLDKPYTRAELDFTAGNTWIFDPAENQGVKQALDDSITVSGDAANEIQNEVGFVDRTDRGDVPDTSTPVELDISSREESTTLQSNPSTEPKAEVSTSAPTEPKTSAPTEPKTSAPTEPKISAPTEPKTSAPTEPKTSAPTEPKTSAPTEPKTSAPTEPKTSVPTEPKTSAPTEPKTSAPTEPKTSAPTEPKTSAPTEPKTSAPTEPKTSAPTEPKTSAPTEPKTSAPTEPKTSAPTQPRTSAPASAPTQPEHSYNTYEPSIEEDVTKAGTVNSTSDIDISSDDIYDDVNNDLDLDDDYSDDIYDDEDIIEETEDIVINDEIVESNGNFNNLLIPGLAVAATAATVGGVAYASSTKKKKESKDLELDEFDDSEYLDDEF